MTQKIKSIKVTKKLPFCNDENILNITFNGLGDFSEYARNKFQIQAESPEKLLEFFPEYFEIEYEKPQTKYRKNGALVFAPKIEMDYWSIESDGRVEKGNWILNFPYNKLKLQQGLIFDNEQGCQIWADKLKIACALKQRIVESESQANGDLGQCYVSTNDKRKVWTLDSFAGFPKQLLVSTIAKDILMSKDVSDEDFKAFIEVFSF